MGILNSVLGAALGGALGRGGIGGAVVGGMLGGGRGGGMLRSPVVKALLVALAAKAAHEYMSRNKEAGDGTGAQRDEGGLGGMLSGVLSGSGGGLGGLLGGLGGAGALGDLLEQFNRRGHGDTIKSWVGPGANASMAPEALEEVLGPEDLAELERETGLARPQLLAELSRELPAAIDQLTPNGHLPTDDELNRTTG